MRLKPRDIDAIKAAAAETFGADADDRVDLSNPRNRLVHEYPIDGIERVDRVDRCRSAAPRLVAMFDTIQAYLAKQGFTA